MLKSSDKRELIRFLNKNNLMTLATGAPKPWVCTVYFVTDSNLNFYFVSSPKSKHCRDIEKNRNVAVAIYDSHTKNSDKKAGIQMQGSASLVKSWKDTEKYLKMWNKKNPGKEKVITVENMKKPGFGARIYRITPTLIKFFNHMLFGKEGAREFIL